MTDLAVSNASGSAPEGARRLPRAADSLPSTLARSGPTSRSSGSDPTGSRSSISIPPRRARSRSP